MLGIAVTLWKLESEDVKARNGYIDPSSPFLLGKETVKIIESFNVIHLVVTLNLKPRSPGSQALISQWKVLW